MSSDSTVQIRQLAGESQFDLRVIGAADGVRIAALPNGSIYSIQLGAIQVNQILASPVAGGVQRIYLRRRGGRAIDFTEIVGPAARSAFAASADALSWSGQWEELSYRVDCRTDRNSFFFAVEVKNNSNQSVRVDAISLLDVGLGARSHSRNNEIFNAQYLDQSIYQSGRDGAVVMTRQNLEQAGAHPWMLQGCWPGAAAASTDGFEFFGNASREGAPPIALKRDVIGKTARQSEAGYVSIQSEAREIASGETVNWVFFASVAANHPAQSSTTDLMRVDDLRRGYEQLPPLHKLTGTQVQQSIFQTSPLAVADDLSDSDIERLYPIRRHEEHALGKLVSFFTGDDSRHIVLREKEIALLRPHGHILRAGRGLMPDDPVMTTACYASGMFASQLTLGNTSLAKVLSTQRDVLNLVRSSGLRIFVNRGGDWSQLATPSAFEMSRSSAKWIYKFGDRQISVKCSAHENDPALTYSLHADEAVQFLIVGEIAGAPTEYDTAPRMSIDVANRRIIVRPEAESMLAKAQPNLEFHLIAADPVEHFGGAELLFASGVDSKLPYAVIRSTLTRAFSFTFTGTIDDPANIKAPTDRTVQSHIVGAKSTFWNNLTADVKLAASDGVAQQLDDTLAWFARDAAIHLATPRGLEQANGGAWGVRDVCQGPLEFLLSYGHGDVAAQILRTLFSQQYAKRLDWPQWFMFPPFAAIQSTHCHGDVLIWPLKALCDYLEFSNDPSILHDSLPYTDDKSFTPTPTRETLLQHVDRLIEKMRGEFLPGTSLPRYGDGDWDDSLQPAQTELRKRMVSSWTTALMFQSLHRYADAMKHFGETTRETTARDMAAAIEADFQKHLVANGVVAGFAIFESDSPRVSEFLLHPSDKRTGLRYRLIPMTRGMLSGIFSKEQAAAHLSLIREHLLYPDGARLMDRPTPYNGGIETVFRRSESAAFFGREIGLQYTHAHLRYAEAMALLGRGEDLLAALLASSPIAVTDVVRNARPRQRNCFFSSSDAAFVNRRDAFENYAKLKTGQIEVDGGWRIYSSGPGIYTSIVLRYMFGLRRYYAFYEFDPVLPRSLDGATVELNHGDKRVKYVFKSSSSPRVIVNGAEMKSTAAANRYRRGGMRVLRSEFESALRGENLVEVHFSRFD